MEEHTKAVTLHYFKETGELHSTEQRVLPSEWSDDYMVQVLTEQRRYQTLDMVVMDSGDNKKPYIAPRLVKAGKEEQRKGFFG